MIGDSEATVGKAGSFGKDGIAGKAGKLGNDNDGNVMLGTLNEGIFNDGKFGSDGIAPASDDSDGRLGRPEGIVNDGKFGSDGIAPASDDSDGRLGRPEKNPLIEASVGIPGKVGIDVIDLRSIMLVNCFTRLAMSIGSAGSGGGAAATIVVCNLLITSVAWLGVDENVGMLNVGRSGSVMLGIVIGMIIPCSSCFLESDIKLHLHHEPKTHALERPLKT